MTTVIEAQDDLQARSCEVTAVPAHAIKRMAAPSRRSGSGLFFVMRLEPELGSRAQRIAPTPAIRLSERHGGTFGDPGDGLLEQFQLSRSRQGLSPAVRP